VSLAQEHVEPFNSSVKFRFTDFDDTSSNNASVTFTFQWANPDDEVSVIANVQALVGLNGLLHVEANGGFLFFPGEPSRYPMCT
jgi:hypothetical protein